MNNTYSLPIAAPAQIRFPECRDSQVLRLDEIDGIDLNWKDDDFGDEILRSFPRKGIDMN